MTSLDVQGTNRLGSNESSKVENIQALRGIAALLVLWAHLRYARSPLLSVNALPSIFQTGHGAIGVDIFFIISGYVICITACKRHHRPFNFICARIARITPLYLVITLLFMLKGTHLWFLSFCSYWNWLFYLPIFDWGDYTSPPLSPGWTLSFEMWFYVVFALFLNWWRPRKVAFFLPIFFILGAALMTLYHPGWYFPRFMFHPFTLEFALGCLIFQAQKHLLGRMSWLLIGVGVIATFTFSPHTGYLGSHSDELSVRLDLAWLRLLIWGVPSALIIAGLVGLEHNCGFVLPRLLIWIGEISYSLYLSHLFSIVIMSRIGLYTNWYNPYLTSVISVTSSICLAWFCWKWIERPLTTRAQQWAKEISGNGSMKF